MKKFLIVVEITSDLNKISRCIDSIIGQSFSDFDVLLVNHYKKFRIMNLLNSYKKLDKRINVINDSSLSTSHKIRTYGFMHCDCEYISFIKSDDYLSCDFMRLMYENIKINNFDIGICSYVNDDNGNKFVYTFVNSILEKNIKSGDMLNDFFESCGCNNRLYKTEFKCINSNVISNFIDQYKKMDIISNLEDDIVLSTMLYNSSKYISYINECEYFLSFSNNISDCPSEVLKTNFLEEYLCNNLLEKYVKYLKKIDITQGAFYSSFYVYNDGLENIKKHIINSNIDIVSFDIFDTLIVRPFYQASDLFDLMDKEFINISKSNPVIKFSKIRKDAENSLRKINFENGIEEVNLNDIYKYIQKFYCISSDVIMKLQCFEEQLELKFCSKRQTGYELYCLAKYLNKKIIIVSDMYLNRPTIEKILNSNGYSWDKIYLSSQLLMTKDSGSLFRYVNDNECGTILHIGDNLHSDIEMANDNNICTEYLPRAIDVFMGRTSINTNRSGSLYEEFDMYNINMNAYLKNSGVRSSLAVIANKYFDNPFKNFVKNSKFNSDPFLIGYYALGMHLLSLSNWILQDTKNKNYDSISFMSRDGYLPLNSSKILQENTNINKNILLNYVYISRKSVIPLLFCKKENINVFQTYFDYSFMTPLKIYEVLSSVLKDYDSASFFESMKKNNINLDCFKSKDDFFECLSIIYDNFFDNKKYDNYFKMVKTYFSKYFVGNAATFDIGYSGKPEALLSFVLDKSISTYFYHATSSEAYCNSYISNYELNTFYDFMPTLTGTIRELFYSDIVPSCIGYVKKNNSIVPIYGEQEKYTYFNKKIIKMIQSSSLEFVNDYSRIFSEYFDYFDLNKFYMSIPYEFFNHYIQDEDKLIFNGLIFESNVNDSKLFTDYIDDILTDYNYYNKWYIENILDKNNCAFEKYIFNKVEANMLEKMKNNINSEFEEKIKKDLLSNGYTSLPKTRFGRILYYSIFDKKKMILKFKQRFKK